MHREIWGDLPKQRCLMCGMRDHRVDQLHREHLAPAQGFSIARKLGATFDLRLSANAEKMQICHTIDQPRLGLVLTGQSGIGQRILRSMKIDKVKLSGVPAKNLLDGRHRRGHMAHNADTHQARRRIAGHHIGSDKFHTPAELVHTKNMAGYRLRACIAIRPGPLGIDDQCALGRQRVSTPAGLLGGSLPGNGSGTCPAHLLGRIQQ